MSHEQQQKLIHFVAETIFNYFIHFVLLVDWQKRKKFNCCWHEKKKAKNRLHCTESICICVSQQTSIKILWKTGAEQRKSWSTKATKREQKKKRKNLKSNLRFALKQKAEVNSISQDQKGRAKTKRLKMNKTIFLVRDEKEWKLLFIFAEHKIVKFKVRMRIKEIQQQRKRKKNGFEAKQNDMKNQKCILQHIAKRKWNRNSYEYHIFSLFLAFFIVSEYIFHLQFSSFFLFLWCQKELNYWKDEPLPSFPFIMIVVIIVECNQCHQMLLHKL